MVLNKYSAYPPLVYYQSTPLKLQVTDGDDEYLDLKCGNLMVQKVTRVKTSQTEIISSLIGQYTDIIAKYERAKKETKITLI